MTDEQRWDEFIGWARRFYTWPEFEREERAYKLEIAARLRAVRDALDDGTDAWLGRLREAFRSPNNLVHWTVKAAFPAWCKAYPERARRALSHLWDGTGSYRDRIDRFAREADKQAVGGMYGMFTSFLLMAVDTTVYPMYRDEAYRLAYRLTGYPDRPKDGSGAIYEHALAFLDTLLAEARRRGLALRDRLDAQSVLWCVAWYKVTDVPVSTWSVGDRDRLLAYRADAGVDPSDGETAVAPDDRQAVWMFQYAPEDYDLAQYVREYGPYDWWNAAQGRTSMRIGQRVYFMRSGGRDGGDHAAIVAVGRVVSAVYTAPEDADCPYWVDVLYEAYVDPPLTRGEHLRADAVLGGYRPFGKGHFGTNFLLPPEVARRTEELVRDRLRPIADVEPDLGAFDLSAQQVDARTRVVAAVVRRQGQPEFRQQLLDAYEGRCAVTGCDAVAALEAAHILPYRGPHTNDVTNGLLLRADLHNLFDLGLLAVDSAAMTVLLAPELRATTYADLEGAPLRLPSAAAFRPSPDALDHHRTGTKVAARADVAQE